MGRWHDRRASGVHVELTAGRCLVHGRVSQLKWQHSVEPARGLFRFASG